MKTKTFIPIECDICYDNRISALINEKGAAGYGVYMILLLELRNRKGYCLDSQSLKMIARNFCIRRKLIDEVLYNYDLFTVEQLENNIIVKSEYVTRVMRNYDDKVAKCSAGGKKSADKRWRKKDNHLITTEQNITEQNTTEKKTTSTVVKEKKTAAVVVATDCNAGKKSISTQGHRNTELFRVPNTEAYPTGMLQKRSLRVPHKDTSPVPLRLCVEKTGSIAFRQHKSLSFRQST